MGRRVPAREPRAPRAQRGPRGRGTAPPRPGGPVERAHRRDAPPQLSLPAVRPISPRCGGGQHQHGNRVRLPGYRAERGGAARAGASRTGRRSRGGASRPGSDLAAADPPRPDPGGVAEACPDQGVREDRHQRHGRHGVQHPLHAFRGAPQSHVAHQVRRCGRPLAAPVPPGSHTGRAGHHRDQTHRHDRVARDRIRADPPQGEADSAGGLSEPRRRGGRVRARLGALVRPRKAARGRVHRRGRERFFLPTSSKRSRRSARWSSSPRRRSPSTP